MHGSIWNDPLNRILSYPYIVAMKPNGISLKLNAKIAKPPVNLKPAPKPGLASHPANILPVSSSSHNSSAKDASIASIFAGDDEDDDEDPTKTNNDAFSAIARVNAKLYGSQSASTPALAVKDLKSKIDPSIYDYDAAYDEIAARREAEKARKEAGRTSIAAKYISDMKAYSELRKREQQIITEQMMIKEREREDAQFSNPIRIVTGAYKRKLEEDARVLAEVAKRDGDALPGDASSSSAREAARKALVTGMSIVNTKGTMLLGAVKGVYGAAPGAGDSDEGVKEGEGSERKNVVTLSSVLGDSIDDAVETIVAEDDADKTLRASKAKERYLQRKRQKLVE